MKPWAELPVAAQVKRIRRALDGMLPQWGMREPDLRFIYHGENTTFQATTSRGSFLIRVHRLGYNSPRETESELIWLEALDGLGPRPVRARDGELVARVNTPGVAASHVCVFRWIEGKIIAHRFSLQTGAEVGSLMARLHEHASSWRQPAHFTRHDWRRMSMFTDEAAPPEVWELLPAEHRREFESVKKAVVPVCRGLSRSGGAGLLHADLHGFNVLRTDHGLAAIDFDDCGFAPWVYDVAVTCGFWRSHHREKYAALMEGYHRVREFPDGQLQHLPLVIAARLAGVCLWLTGRAQENAKFRKDLRENQDRLLRRVREALARKFD